MKKSLKIGLGVGLALLTIYTIKQRFNDTPKLFYIKGSKNGRFSGITIPPFGIFANKNIIGDNFNPEEQFRIHEGVHWKQFQKLGLLGFYYNYLKDYFKNGSKYRNNPMEQEAYIVAKQVKKINPNIKPTNYSGLLI